VKYQFINDYRAVFKTATMCRVLRASRSGFYAWLHKPLSDRTIEDRRLLGLIRDSYAASSGVYGYLRVYADLQEAGETCGKHRVARIMRENRIKALRGYKAPRHIGLGDRHRAPRGAIETCGGERPPPAGCRSSWREAEGSLIPGMWESGGKQP